MKDLTEELDAKAWQSARHKKRARSPAQREDHVCFRAAREIERLRKIVDAPAAERGWRSFWQGFCEHLRLTDEQRTYTWHELMDGCKTGMNAVQRDTKEKP